MTASSPPIWSASGFSVDARVIRTPRTSIAMEHVDYVDVRRPLLVPSAALAAIGVGLSLRFTDVLYLVEIGIVLGIAGASLAVGCIVARISLQSYSIRDVAFFLPVWTARPMRAAIEPILAKRERHPTQDKRSMSHDSLAEPLV